MSGYFWTITVHLKSNVLISFNFGNSFCATEYNKSSFSFTYLYYLIPRLTFKKCTCRHYIHIFESQFYFTRICADYAPSSQNDGLVGKILRKGTKIHTILPRPSSERMEAGLYLTIKWSYRQEAVPPTPRGTWNKGCIILFFFFFFEFGDPVVGFWPPLILESSTHGQPVCYFKQKTLFSNCIRQRRFRT